jgi:hypothetical protein|tara:strand:- start:1859 stop:2056 length:198 start_codon:yes stop_codon:yes gene_type:complete
MKAEKINESWPINSNSELNSPLTAALNEAFEAGTEAFTNQLALLSDQQYVHLLTLLDEYTSPLRT